MLLKCENGNHLTTSEQVAIDYINDHVDTIADLTITEIATKAFVSTATISRAIRKCGIEKLPDVRYKIAMSEVAKDNFVINDILDKAYKECTKTIEMIDTTSIKKIVHHIRLARKIHIVARGNTRLMAQEFEFLLQCQGFNAYVHWDTEIMKRFNQIAMPNDLVIIFSVTNSVPQLATAAKLAKESGATVVSCCCKGGTLLEKNSDITVVGYTQLIVSKKGFENSSNLGLQIIARTIVEYLSIE